MDTETKLDILMSLAADDHEGRPGSDVVLPPRLRNMRKAGALRPFNLRDVRVGSSGPKAKLFRILMTNACSFNCHYCPMRRDRELPRTLLKPQEMVRIFLHVLARGWASGLFITTGIPAHPVKVMDDLITVLELLRERHAFRGYIHVKIVPGAETAQVDRITALANRVSVNLEAPCGDSLTAIAPEKRIETTLVALRRAQQRVVEGRAEEREGRPRDALLPQGAAGLTTQFVVGATPDTDHTIMGKTVELYAAGGVHHTHFSAFRPIRDTPLENARGAPPLREHRLYQADHLLRDYRFAYEELVFGADGNLPLAHDPKVAWALAHPEQFPLDAFTASYSALLRVPGIGPLSARRLVEQRRASTVRGLSDLQKLGVAITRAQGFLAWKGKRLGAERWKEQLSLWDVEEAQTLGMRNDVFEFSPGTFR
ncbi:MAG: putative DNA modification/repair radical SAM protein [Gemmatimonadaceae bacterium]|nr:putative DNA modification/repair radical SAM protein [Gemmatimonadaceae bacterium]